MRSVTKNILINVLIFLSVYFVIYLYQTRHAPTGVAPEIKGVMLNGDVFEGLSKIPKPVLVHYWATWCKICEFEHENISQIAEDYPVVGIVTQSGNLAEIKTYVDAHNITYPVLIDDRGYNAAQWGIVGFPTSFIVGDDNEIYFTEVGFTSEFGVRARLWLASIF